MFLCVRHVLVLEYSIQGSEQGATDVPLVMCGALVQAQEIVNKKFNVRQEVRIMEAEH